MATEATSWLEAASVRLSSLSAVLCFLLKEYFLNLFSGGNSVVGVPSQQFFVVGLLGSECSHPSSRRYSNGTES